MSGPGAFQSNAFQANAFQIGVNLVASDYSLGSPIFSLPVLGGKYILHVNDYVLGSPVFDKPTLFVTSLVVHINPYTLGALAWGSVSLRQINNLAVDNYYSLGSPTFDTPPIIQTNQKFFVNDYGLELLDFGVVHYIHNYHFAGNNDLILGSPYFAFAGPVIVDVVFGAQHDYILGSPRFDYPLMTAAPDPNLPVYPPTYYTQLLASEDLVITILDKLMASMPPVINTQTNYVRSLSNALRANVANVLRDNTMGTQLGQIYAAVNATNPIYGPIEDLRVYLMGLVNMQGALNQAIISNALFMTLALEASIVTNMDFASSQDAQNMLNHMADAFEAARETELDKTTIDVYQNFIQLAGASTRLLSLEELQLPKLVNVSFPATLPSLYIAHRIYQDASRSDEIEAENNVVHPAFCPRNLVVLSDA